MIWHRYADAPFPLLHICASRVMLVRLENNKVVQYVPFASGWLGNDGKVTGRPVDIEFAEDGSMLVSDDLRGAIYRITFNK